MFHVNISECCNICIVTACKNSQLNDKKVNESTHNVPRKEHHHWQQHQQEQRAKYFFTWKHSYTLLCSQVLVISIGDLFSLLSSEKKCPFSHFPTSVKHFYFFSLSHSHYLPLSHALFSLSFSHYIRVFLLHTSLTLSHRQA